NISSLLSLLGMKGPSRAHAGQQSILKRRRLGFENCESRQLLAGASIFGTVVQTPSSSGFSPTDVAMPGVPIELYKDNGDNNFDPGTDMLAKPTQNSAPVTGAFSFTDIADGHYYL